MPPGSVWGSGRTLTKLRANWLEHKRWAPSWDEGQRAAGYAGWQKAVGRTLDWVDLS